jgi:hypothetical protein
MSPTTWEVATDPRADLGLRRVSRRPSPTPQPSVTRRQEQGVVWVLRSLAIASGAGLCSLSSDQDLTTILVGGGGLLSVLAVSVTTLDWLAGGESRARVRAALLAAWQVACVLLAVLALPIAWPLSLWLQARAKRGGRGR